MKNQEKKEFSWDDVNMSSKKEFFTDEMAENSFLFVEGLKTRDRAPSKKPDGVVVVNDGKRKGNSVIVRRGNRYHFTGSL